MLISRLESAHTSLLLFLRRPFKVYRALLPLSGDYSPAVD